MTDAFSFLAPSPIVFGSGKVRELGQWLPRVVPGELRRCLVVTGSDRTRAAPVIAVLEELRVEFECVCTSGEPSVADAERALQRVRDFAPQAVLGIGGGSAIDLAKALAALLPNEGQPLDYLEVIGRGLPLACPALPTVALPTTSGTGAEVTKNAVLRSEEHGVKVSLRHDSMVPRLALVDPELTHSVPPQVTAATGLDALTQCIEPYLSCLANPLTDGLAREGIRRGARSLRRAVETGSDPEARRDMSLCSLFGGLALANAKLGAVHGIAGPFGGAFESPHGAVCARLLPVVLRVNLRALQERQPKSPVLGRLAELAVLLTGDGSATVELGILWLEKLVSDLSVPALGTYGMTRNDLSALAKQSLASSSMKGNPIVLTLDEVQECIERAL